MASFSFKGCCRWVAMGLIKTQVASFIKEEGKRDTKGQLASSIADTTPGLHPTACFCGDTKHRAAVDKLAEWQWEMHTVILNSPLSGSGKGKKDPF